MGYSVVIILISLALLIIEIRDFRERRRKKKKQYKSGFIITSITAEMPGTFFFTSNKKNMKSVQFRDGDAQNKSCTVTATLKKDAAGNFPDLKPDSFRVEGDTPDVSTPSVGDYDAANGKVRLKIKYTGKKGASVSTLFASGDLDNSGDPEISFSVASIISAEEATGFDDELEVSELQEEPA